MILDPEDLVPAEASRRHEALAKRTRARRRRRGPVVRLVGMLVGRTVHL